MSEHFNKLSPAEAEALALLAEECAEVIQVVGKILRHGLASAHPNGGPSNSELLDMELGDVRAAADILILIGVVNSRDVAHRRCNKLRRVGRYLHHITLPGHEQEGP